MAQVRVTPSGYLDKDTDLSYVSNGNYVDANDIRHRQSVGNNFGGVMGVKGNSNLITLVNGSSGTTLPTVPTTTKKYRVYIDYSFMASGAASNMDGILVLTDTSNNTSTKVVSISPTSIINLAFLLQVEFATLFNLKYGSSPTITPSSSPYYTSTGTNTGYFTITISTAVDTDYVLSVNNTNSRVPLCKIVLEDQYITTSTTLRPIGSYQLEDYLFVWSASEASVGTKSNVSEIGVVYSTNQGETYQYKTLCRTSNLGFFKERRIDAQVERVGSQINFYWTDGNEKPRAMYLDYSKVTTQNGFMYWEGGRYEHDTIDIETSFFFRVPKSYIDVTAVLNEGGSLTAGNKRYTGRFLTEDLITTEFLYPTNPINIYATDTNVPSFVHGDESNVITDKSVTMVVKNITPGIYKFFELAVIEYVDDAFTSTIVQRYTLNDTDTEINVSHVGRGQDNIPLGVNELVAIFTRYIAAENIRIHDNRVVLSNLKEQIDYDLSQWALAFTHSLESKTIPALGFVVDNTHSILDDPGFSDEPSAVLEALEYGLDEYINPLNTMRNTSYMFNDTYRFGVQVKWKTTGKWSPPYYVDDIRFDNLSYNIDSGDTRRIGNNIISNLTDSTNQNVYINYIKFHNINLEYLVNGKPLRELIEGFRIVRAERIPEVLATGYFVLGNSPSTTSRDCFQPGALGSGLGFYSFDTTDINNTTSTIDIGTTAGLVEDEAVYYENNGATATTGLSDQTYYYISIVNSSEIRLKTVPGGPTVTLFASSLGTGYTLTRGFQIAKHSLTPRNGSDVLFFHSPDHFYIDRDYEFNLNTDSIKILGPSKTNFSIIASKTSVAGRAGIYAETSGYFSSATRSYLTINSNPSNTPHLDDYVLLDMNQKRTLPTLGVTVDNKRNLLNDIFVLSTPLRQTSGSYFASGLANGENEGIFYGQIFRDLGASEKYPQNRENTTYHSVGHFYYLSNSNVGVLNNVEVYGGDVYTQKTHLPISIRSGDWHSVMLGCYTQNVVNSQMYSIEEDDSTLTGLGYRWPVYFDKTKDSTYKIQPSTHAEPWFVSNSVWSGLINFLYQTVVPQRFYNRSYDYKDRSLVEQGFYLNAGYSGELPTRIVWSAKKATGSNKDNYRLGFGPTEFAELDLTYGPIVHHEVINNSFYTLQPFSFQRQYFRDASLIGAQEGTDVVVGSGSILGSPGQELTSIGSEYKWSQLKGQTEAGKESFYWYNNRLKKIMRFGMDGVRPISDRGIVTLLQNNTNWLYDKKYPLSGIGIHGVWNDKYNEAIFTFKATNPNIGNWVSEISYVVGTYVYVTSNVHSSGLPYAYKAKVNHTSSSTNRPETGANWQSTWTKIVPGTDAYAHTCLSLVYDEMKNGFIDTHSYWPDIYLQYQNVFWSPNPNAKNTLWLHDANINQTYYGQQFIPSITGVMNLDPNMSKNFEALQVNSDISPSSVDFFTNTHQSYLDETEFDAREGYFYSPIKNDILTAPLGTPVEDTSRLWGKWIKVKIHLEAVANNQKLVNFIVKFRPMPRLYNQ